MGSKAAIGLGTLVMAMACAGCGDGGGDVFGSSAAGGSGGTGSSGTGQGGSASSTTGSAGSTSSASSGSGGAPSCAGLGDPCTECESTTCPAEYCACYNNPDCVKLAQCAATSGCAPSDVACNQACWTANPAGISDGALLAHCAATVCTQQCPGYMALTPCQKCLYESCSAAMNVCIANPECTQLLYCLDCQTPGCQNACYSMYPGGLADSGPVAMCVQNQCAMACAMP